MIEAVTRHDRRPLLLVAILLVAGACAFIIWIRAAFGTTRS